MEISIENIDKKTLSTAKKRINYDRVLLDVSKKQADLMLFFYMLGYTDRERNE